MTSRATGEESRARRRRTRRTAVPKRAVGRPRVIPAEVRRAADPIESALWIGHRNRRCKPIVGHPWFPAILGRMAAGMSMWRIAKWLWDELPEGDPLRTVGFDPLYRRPRRFPRLMPEGVLAVGLKTIYP